VNDVEEQLAVLNRFLSAQRPVHEPVPAASVVDDWQVDRYRDAVVFVSARGRTNRVFMVRGDRVVGYSPMTCDDETAYAELVG
jgi:hypothetical protein